MLAATAVTAATAALAAIAAIASLALAILITIFATISTIFILQIFAFTCSMSALSMFAAALLVSAGTSLVSRLKPRLLWFDLLSIFAPFVLSLAPFCVKRFEIGNKLLYRHLGQFTLAPLEAVAPSFRAPIIG